MIDAVLTALLIVAVPGHMMGKSLQGRGKPPEAKLARYLRSILMALVLDGLLLADWLRAGRSVAALGLAIPGPTAGIVGIAVAAGGLVALAFVMRAQGGSAKAPDMAVTDLLPVTTTEFAVFIAFCLICGCSWELLFRGYLLWALQPIPV